MFLQSQGGTSECFFVGTEEACGAYCLQDKVLVVFDGYMLSKLLYVLVITCRNIYFDFYPHTIKITICNYHHCG